jgi:cytochrome c biogenesis protein CcmG, thiol:disulfide interchange protein DsbE
LAARSSRRLVTGVLLAVAVVIPVGALLLDRGSPGRDWAPRTPPPTAATAVQTYPPGKAAPPLRLRTLDGGTLDLAALRGRPVVVNFWATWCEPCVREFPLLARAAAGHRADRLAVVGVLVQDRPDAARAFVRQHGGDWPMGVDADRRTADAWRVVGLPQSFFVRPDGTLATHQLGELTPATLDRQLAAILRG